MTTITEAYEMTYFNNTEYDYEYDSANLINIDWHLFAAIIGICIIGYILYNMCRQMCLNATRRRYYRDENL